MNDNEDAKPCNRQETRERILAHAAHLFAIRGFDGVSMRDVAAAVSLTQAALYYHFPDKEQLYLLSIAHECRKREVQLKAFLNSQCCPWERLEAFVTGMSRMIAADTLFLRLMQWTFLDSDEERCQKLTLHVFQDMILTLQDLAGKLAPERDPCLLANSIIGLVVFHFQCAAIYQFLPQHPAQSIRPDFLAEHVLALLRHGLLTGKHDSPTPAQTLPDFNNPATL